jgi:hypothetical protein
MSFQNMSISERTKFTAAAHLAEGQVLLAAESWL